MDKKSVLTLISTAQGSLERINGYIQGLQQSIDSKDQEIDQLKSTLEVRDKEVEGLREYRDAMVKREVELVDKIEKELTSSWISVEERLPEIGKTVLIAGGCGYWDGKAWHTRMDGPTNPVIMWEVTRWQPLPEPPEEA